MNKEDNSVVIQQVNEEVFDDFLGLIDKLAKFEKLAPPNEEERSARAKTTNRLSI